MINTEVEKVVECCQQKLGLSTAEERDPIPYQSVPLCVIDAVYSVRAPYESVRDSIGRYCNFFGVQERREEKNTLPQREAQESVGVFLDKFKDRSPEKFADEIFKNPRKTNGKLKSEIVFGFASSLASLNVEYLQDVPVAVTNDDFEKEIRDLFGVGEWSYKYFLMLCRLEDYVKVDTHVRKFVRDCICWRANPGHIECLLEEAHKILVTNYPGLTLRLLDHEIWLYSTDPGYLTPQAT